MNFYFYPISNYLQVQTPRTHITPPDGRARLDGRDGGAGPTPTITIQPPPKKKKKKRREEAKESHPSVGGADGEFI